MMENNTSKYTQAIIVVLLFIVYELGSKLYKTEVNDNANYITRDDFQRKIDSVIAPKDKIISILRHRVSERDSLLLGLTSAETSIRDGVFVSLENRFEAANDSAKESLINEALNDIND